MTEEIIHLGDLAQKINTAHRLAEKQYQSAIAQARLAGEYLSEAKSQVQSGQWQNWVAQNCQFSLRTAQVYMRIFSNWEMLEAQESAPKSLDSALALLALPREEKEDPIPEEMPDWVPVLMDQRHPQVRILGFTAQGDGQWVGQVLPFWQAGNKYAICQLPDGGRGSFPYSAVEPVLEDVVPLTSAVNLPQSSPTPLPDPDSLPFEEELDENGFDEDPVVVPEIVADTVLDIEPILPGEVDFSRPANKSLRGLIEWLFELEPAFINHRRYSRALDPCSGAGVIASVFQEHGVPCLTNDVDKRIQANFNENACSVEFWDSVKSLGIDRVVCELPFIVADKIIPLAFDAVEFGIAVIIPGYLLQPKNDPFGVWLHSHQRYLSRLVPTSLGWLVVWDKGCQWETRGRVDARAQTPTPVVFGRGKKFL